MGNEGFEQRGLAQGKFDRPGETFVSWHGSFLRRKLDPALGLGGAVLGVAVVLAMLPHESLSGLVPLAGSDVRLDVDNPVGRVVALGLAQTALVEVC